jgi:hypothetical protein
MASFVCGCQPEIETKSLKSRAFKPDFSHELETSRASAPLSVQ